MDIKNAAVFFEDGSWIGIKGAGICYFDKKVIEANEGESVKGRLATVVMNRGIKPWHASKEEESIDITDLLKWALAHGYKG